MTSEPKNMSAALVELRQNRGGAALATVIQPLFFASFVTLGYVYRVLGMWPAQVIVVLVGAWMLRQTWRTWRVARTGEPHFSLHADRVEYTDWPDMALPLCDVRNWEWREKRHATYLVFHLTPERAQREGERERLVPMNPFRAELAQKAATLNASLNQRLAACNQNSVPARRLRGEVTTVLGARK